MKNTAQKSTLVRLLNYSSTYRRQTILASIYSVLNRLFDLAPPVLIGIAVDVVVSQEDSFLGRWVADPVYQLVLLAGITIVIWTFESLFQYMYGVAWRNLAQNIQHDLRLETYANLQTLDMGYFEDQSTGSLTSILNDDINQLERFLDFGANDILQLLTTVVAISTMFFVVIPSVAWLALLPIPFILIGSLRFQKKLTPLYAAVRERVGIMSGQLANNISGIITIKSYTAEEFENRRILHLSEEYQRTNRDAIRLSSAFVPLIRMVVIVGFLAIMVFGGILVLNGQLNVGAYSVLVFMTQRLLWPLTRLGETLDQYQRAMASTSRVLNLLDTHSTIKSGSASLPVAAVRGAVSFQDVCFSYKDRLVVRDNGHHAREQFPIIQSLSIHVAEGNTIAIVGATGSGKSTLVKLLLRLYDVQDGRICLDGQDIRQIKLGDLRRAIGYVGQDVFLFHGTVRENIAYGTFDAPLEDIVAAAKVAEAHEFINELPEGYETIVGERGQKLSGGQRQRISIARAVLKDPPVLILDEATSSVDNETEAAIQRSLEQIIIGRTTIVIAHRLSTVRHADLIYVLEKGELREQGCHEELIAADGIYAALWRVQTGMLAG